MADDVIIQYPFTVLSNFWLVGFSILPMESEPILVRATVSENAASEEHEEVDAAAEQRPLTVPIPEEVLQTISKNTTELQARLDKFINGLNAKIQSVSPGYIYLAEFNDS
jgi:hypothetical protein